MATKLKVKVKDRWYTVEVEDPETDPVRVLVDGDVIEVAFGSQPALGPAPPVAGSEVGVPQSERPSPRPPSPGKVFHSPMHGVIMSVAVRVGDQVVTGDEVCVLEAMKMQQMLRADWSGIVAAVHVQPGQQVLDGEPLIELE